MIKQVKTAELFSDIPALLKELFEKAEFPWQVLPQLKEYLIKLIDSEPSGYKKLCDGVIVGENVKIYDGAVIEGPAVIGAGTQIRVGAFIRGSVFCGENCVIGNSSELKNSILLSKVQVPHYNYVGDSVLGNGSHTGAGVICSNLKSDGKCVVVHGECEYETGLRKLGAILADGADIGCGSVINPGTVIGKNTSVYPLTSLRGVYPANCIVKSTENVVKRI